MPTHKRFQVLLGKRFGKLVVMKFHGIVDGSTKWECLCDCGVTKPIRAGTLKSGDSTTCGCGKKTWGDIDFTVHGHNRKGRATPEYRAWICMIQRCTDKNTPNYHLYGGRGIKVCSKWRHSFQSFLNDVGYKPDKKYSIDRIDNDKDYEPSNVRWADRKQQTRNRRCTVMVSFQGETLPLAELAERVGMKYRKVYKRWASGMPIEKAISGTDHRGVKDV